MDECCILDYGMKNEKLVYFFTLFKLQQERDTDIRLIVKQL